MVKAQPVAMSLDLCDAVARVANDETRANECFQILRFVIAIIGGKLLVLFFSVKTLHQFGNFALGFFPVCIIKEVLLRVTPLRRGGWFTFIVLSVVLAIAAFYEFIEWWSTYVFASDVGQAFLGSQGDPWDAQWDMFLGLVGGAVGLIVLGRVHDRSMARWERLRPRDVPAPA